MLKGAQLGSRISSGGILGVPFQLHCRNSASQILVKTRVCGTPPRLRMNSRARASGSAAAEWPASFKAK